MNLKELIAQRKASVARLDAILKKAETGNRDLDASEKAEYDKIETEIKALDEKIDRCRRADDMRRRQAEQDAYLAGSDDQRHTPDSEQELEGSPVLSAKQMKDLQAYSFIKAIRQSLPNSRLDGLEAEMHQEAVRLARHAGTTVNGLGIPQVVLAFAGTRRNFGGRRMNDLTVTGGSGGSEGGALVPTELRPVIDILREKLMVRAMGATLWSDLRGVVDVPAAVSDSDPEERSENGTAGENSPTFTVKRLTPHRLPVVAEVSKQLLMQSSTDVEAWLRDYLAFRLSSRMDKMAIKGTGADNQPLGILNHDGVGLVSIGDNGGAPTRDHIVALEGEVAQDNADVGNLGYLTTVKARTKLKLVKLDAGSGRFVWEERNSLNGYNAQVSTNVPSNLAKGSGTDLSAMIFGNWAGLIQGQWGGFDLLVNPYSKDSQGLIRINLETYYDQILEHPEYFAVIKDILTTI